MTVLLYAVGIWLVLGFVGAALRLWITAKIEIAGYDVFEAALFALLGPIGLVAALEMRAEWVKNDKAGYTAD